jgi:hypothetical protein
MSIKILHPWELRVSGGYKYIELNIQSDRVDIQHASDADIDNSDGWFAVYEQEVFGVFMESENSDSVPALLLRGKVCPLTPDTKLHSRLYLTHRAFTLSKGRNTIRFNYQRLWWNLIRRPIFAISNVLFADDWWGVVCDLPSWVESQWNSGTLSDSLLAVVRKN